MSLSCAGVDWAAVETFVDLKKKLGSFEPSGKDSEPDPKCASYTHTDPFFTHAI